MIEAWIDIRNQADKGSGFSVLLRMDRYMWLRSFACGKITSNQAEFKAIEYVLLSIVGKFIGEEIVVLSSGRYVPMMLERLGDVWKRTPSRNLELVERIRNLAMGFHKLSVKTGVNTDAALMQIRSLTDEAIKSGQGVFEKRP
jgi:hypothetical protein